MRIRGNTTLLSNILARVIIIVGDAIFYTKTCSQVLDTKRPCTFCNLQTCDLSTVRHLYPSQFPSLFYAWFSLLHLQGPVALHYTPIWPRPATSCKSCLYPFYLPPKTYKLFWSTIRNYMLHVFKPLKNFTIHSVTQLYSHTNSVPRFLIHPSTGCLPGLRSLISLRKALYLKVALEALEKP